MCWNQLQSAWDQKSILFQKVSETYFGRHDWMVAATRWETLPDPSHSEWKMSGTLLDLAHPPPNKTCPYIQISSRCIEFPISINLRDGIHSFLKKSTNTEIGTNTFTPATSPNSQQQLAAASAGYVKLLEDFGNFHWCDQRGLNQLDSSARHYVCSTLHMSYRYTYSRFIYIYIFRQSIFRQKRSIFI